MAIIEKYPIRRLRIEGNPGNTIGCKIRVTDTDTGELILNIRRIVLTLDATEINQA